MTKLHRVCVALLVVAAVLFAALQRLDLGSPWWLELSRYLPYPVYLAPPFVALGLSIPLGRWWCTASAAALLLTATITMDLHARFAPPPLPGGARLRLMTYNVKAYKAVERNGGLAALAREVALRKPDILLLQDAQSDIGGSPFAGDALVFGLPHVFIADQYVVATRLPLRSCRLRHTDPPYLDYVGCVVEVDGRPVHIVNAHLESPREGLLAARRAGLDGAEDWRQNYQERLLQSRALASDLEDLPQPLVVAGDLNAPQASPVVRGLLALGLQDAFAAAGTGYGYSYGQALKVGFSFLRIDHILVSKEMEVTECFVGDSGPSDHRPVVADLLLTR